MLSFRLMPQLDEIRPMSDHALAEQIAGTEPGGAAAEEAELCRRFARRVRLYGLPHLRDAHAAEDLVQGSLRDATPRGKVSALTLTRSVIERLEREGVPVRHDVVHPGETVACQATPDHFSTYKRAHSAAGDF